MINDRCKFSAILNEKIKFLNEHFQAYIPRQTWCEYTIVRQYRISGFRNSAHNTIVSPLYKCINKKKKKKIRIVLNNLKIWVTKMQYSHNRDVTHTKCIIFLCVMEKEICFVNYDVLENLVECKNHNMYSVNLYSRFVDF